MIIRCLDAVAPFECVGRFVVFVYIFSKIFKKNLEIEKMYLSLQPVSEMKRSVR